MFLNINKPLFLSSFQVVSLIRKKTNIKKVGHAGTLDPMAQGVLVLAVGRESTKQINVFLESDKEYIAEIVFGLTTDSLDREGFITEISPFYFSDTKCLLDKINSFQGEIEQAPPMFSAVHYKGKRLYQLARQGKQIEDIPKRKVFLEKIEILALDNYQNGFPVIKLKLNCSKGFYVRSFARDIALSLGTRGFLKSLTRTKLGQHHIKDSIALLDFLTSE